MYKGLFRDVWELEKCIWLPAQRYSRYFRRLLKVASCASIFHSRTRLSISLGRRAPARTMALRRPKGALAHTPLSTGFIIFSLSWYGLRPFSCYTSIYCGVDERWTHLKDQPTRVYFWTRIRLMYPRFTCDERVIEKKFISQIFFLQNPNFQTTSFVTGVLFQDTSM